MENKALNPCPFCGGKAKFVTISNNSNHFTVGFDFEIKCEKCGVGMPRGYTLSLELGESGEVVTEHDERDIAVNEWNQRISEEGKNENI